MTTIEKLSVGLSQEVRQFAILTRHFFHRFFQNDLVDFEDQMKEKVITGLVFLAILGGHIANSTLMKYLFIPEEGLSWVEKCYFFFFFMTFLGFITVIDWEVIFPDRRDYANLIPLPVRLRTLLLAKSASFFLLIGLYSLAANALATLVFIFYLPQHQSTSPLWTMRYAAAHLASALLSNALAFFLCASIQGLLMSLFSYRLYRKINVLARFILLTLFFFLMLFSLTESVSLPQSLKSFPELRFNDALFLRVFPPMWFVGVYETLLGQKDPFFHGLAQTAMLGLAVTILLFFLTAYLSYFMHLKKSVEVERGRGRLKKVKHLLGAAFNGLFLRNLTQRAVFHFFGKTLARSTPHKMRLFAYLAISTGLVLILLASTNLVRRELTVTNRTLLAIPLIMSFFLLVGLRSLVNVPVSLEANWLFRLTERSPRRHYIAGFKKGIFFLWLVPLHGLFYFFYWPLWGWKPALWHCLFGLTASLLLVEILFFGRLKIPFACSYLPGKARIHLYWLFYVLGFLLFVSGLSSLERSFFSHPDRFYYFYGVMGMLFLASQLYSEFFLYRRRPILYEEEAEPVLISLEALSGN
ncbi:MAG: hypothetical protein AB1715_06490 [Acidobacteriota bacterium]